MVIHDGDQRLHPSCHYDKGCLMKISRPSDFHKDLRILFVREPMSRLVSAWKDKIARSEGRAYYYNLYTKQIIEKYLGIRPAPQSETEAAERGISVDFPTFAKWVADGHYK